jgi:hypothetical protein
MFNLFRRKNTFDDPELNGHIIAIRLILNHVVRSMKSVFTGLIGSVEGFDEQAPSRTNPVRQ